MRSTKKTLIIIRGLPGSGKSTLARALVTSMQIMDSFEADAWFEIYNKGVFEKEKLREAHEWCQAVTKEGVSLWNKVAVANTFTQLWEIQPYFKIAEEAGACVQIITCQGGWKNIHGVLDEHLARMRSRWEHVEIPAHLLP